MKKKLAMLTAGVLALTAGTASGQTVAREWNETCLNVIRIDFPHPPVQARNLYHLAAAMWDAWAAYDDRANTLFHHERAIAGNVQAARETTISYAAYRVLSHRYSQAVDPVASQAMIDAKMMDLGFDPNVTTLLGDTPAALGNRIAATIIAQGLTDGSNEVNGYVPPIPYVSLNDPLVFDLPGNPDLTAPNNWQPLAFDFRVTQNGIIIGESVQEFLGPHWGDVTAFAISKDPGEPVYFDPGAPPLLGGATDDEFKDAINLVMEYSSRIDPTQAPMIDISPASFGNSTLGTNDGTGYDVNPVTGLPYEPYIVNEADWGRLVAEFWADGPTSETPPGHWNTLGNDVTDYVDFTAQLGGIGAPVDQLEFDVKMYIAINGATHDAAIATWGCKGFYDYIRPISMIRYMGPLGQSDDAGAPFYHPHGVHEIAGLVEIIRPETITAGERHEHLAPYVGEAAVYTWQGEPEDIVNDIGGVGWIRAADWLPYQRDTFVTPAFAGYTSGHSAFSRAGAEALTGLTGTEYFPGGLGSYLKEEGTLLFEAGPTTDVLLQWATYYDAADEAGISRLWGGIHVPADDGPGRITGSNCGLEAWAKAKDLFRGSDICQADRTGDGLVTVLDLLAYLEDYFAGSLNAEMTGDFPLAEITVIDLLGYLEVWFPAFAVGFCD